MVLFFGRSLAAGILLCYLMFVKFFVLLFYYFYALFYRPISTPINVDISSFHGCFHRLLCARTVILLSLGCYFVLVNCFTHCFCCVIKITRKPWKTFLKTYESLLYQALYRLHRKINNVILMRVCYLIIK